MKKITKILALVMALAFVLGTLASCGNTETVDTTAASEAESTEAAETSAAADETVANAEPIIFGTNAEFPPFESVSANGVITSEDGSQSFDGIDMAIATKIAEMNGTTAYINNIEFDSLLIALQNGQIDATIAGMTITEERAETVDFSVPYYTATQVMIVKEGSDIKTAADMSGKTIAVVQGYTGETVVNEMGYEYEAFKKGTECIMELNNDKCDVVVIDSATAQKYVSDNPGLVIVEDSNAFASEEYGIAVAKGNTELLNKINTAIEAMLADGTIAELAVQYTEAA